MREKKNLLELLRPNRTDGKQARTVERIAAIGHSCDAVGWRPVAYTVPERYAAFCAGIDGDIDAFLSAASPDLYNARYFSDPIGCETTLALRELAFQRIEHKRSIHNIRLYQAASKADLENQLRHLERALDEDKEGSK